MYHLNKLSEAIDNQLNCSCISSNIFVIDCIRLCEEKGTHRFKGAYNINADKESWLLICNNFTSKNTHNLFSKIPLFHELHHFGNNAMVPTKNNAFTIYSENVSIQWIKSLLFHIFVTSLSWRLFHGFVPSISLVPLDKENKVADPIFSWSNDHQIVDQLIHTMIMFFVW